MRNCQNSKILQILPVPQLYTLRNIQNSENLAQGSGQANQWMLQETEVTLIIHFFYFAHCDFGSDVVWTWVSKFR